MEAAEYSDVVRSMTARTAISFTVAFAMTIGASYTHVGLGALPTFFLLLIFFFTTGIKIFPSSGSWMTRRFRNYRRQQAGRPVANFSDVPTESYLDDYRRG
jgi:hypothetical protein